MTFVKPAQYPFTSLLSRFIQPIYHMIHLAFTHAVRSKQALLQNIYRYNIHISAGPNIAGMQNNGPPRAPRAHLLISPRATYRHQISFVIIVRPTPRHISRKVFRVCIARESVYKFAESLGKVYTWVV